MAYNEAPSRDTHSTRPFPIFKEYVVRPDSTSGKDIEFLNGFIEPVKHEYEEENEFHFIKRDGSESLVASQVALKIRGLHYWKDQQKLIYCADDNVYVYNIATTVISTLSNFFGTTTGRVGFCEFLYDDNTTVVIATDGTTLKSIDSSNTIVTCADGDLPTHLPYPVFLDGYLFLAEAGSADIYNSNLNDPMLWEPGDFISSEMEGDILKAITKINNYLVAFGTNTIEYFWDAANASGSPLQRNDTPVKINGFLGGLAQYGNNVYFVGNSVQSQPAIFFLEDLKIKELSNPTLQRNLSRTTTDFADWHGSIVAFQGHVFYVINVDTATYAYDVGTKQWAKWGYQSGSTFKIMHSTAIKAEDGSYLSVFTLDQAASNVYVFRPTLYQDSATNFTAQIITGSESFSTVNRKTMHRLSFYADSPTSDSSITVYWSDDDYVTWSSGISVNLKQDLPCCYRLGWFRQRAFKFTYTDNYPLRIQRVEVDINKGST